MAVEKDQSAWLPEPPPPRPARRDAAIAAALRKFDGSEHSAPAAWPEPRRSWASTHRPQVAVMVSAALLVVVGVPAALIGIRNEAPKPESAAPPVASSSNGAARHTPPVVQAPAPPMPSVAPKPTEPAQAVSRASTAEEVTDRREVAHNEEPPAPVMAPPPPAAQMAAAPPAPPAPPPPPPPPPMARGERDSGQAMADNVVVSGTRIAKPSLSAPNRFESKAIGGQAYSPFLSRLQAAFRANDRRSIIAMIGFPLRVNFSGGARQYRDASSVQGDFDRIFTPKVRRAVLDQRADRLFVRDQGAMVGDGELWFRETCPNSACSPIGPVRIVAVNP